jgi:hypothetical protein
MRFLQVMSAGLALLTPLAVRAATITVTLSMQNGDAYNLSTGVGLVDGPVSVTFVGNTANVVPSFEFYQLSTFSSATLYVGGMASFAITDPDLFVYVNTDFPSIETGLPTGYGGFVDNDGAAGLYISVNNDAFETYALNASFGPYTSNSEMDGIETVNTSGGEFHLNSDQFTNVTYTATVTPEPSSLVLMGTGLVALAWLGRWRFVKRWSGRPPSRDGSRQG